MPAGVLVTVSEGIMGNIVVSCIIDQCNVRLNSPVKQEKAQNEKVTHLYKHNILNS